MRDPDTALPFDVIIIGSGVVGSAIARELARFDLRIAVLEKELDVCLETSGRNSGVIHAGFNSRTGALMARFCVEGCLGFDAVAAELDIPFRRTGKVVVGFDEADRRNLQALKEQGDRNGVPGLAIIPESKLKELAPHVCGSFSLYSPATGIVNPFIYTIALAENACLNGVSFCFDQEVLDVRRADVFYEIRTGRAVFKTRWVINAAGLNADKIARLFGLDAYTIFPCRGEYYVLDKKAGQFLSMPAYPAPNIREGGLGVHLTPTVDGNILIGPSTEYLDDPADYATTRPTLDLLLRDGSRIFPFLKKELAIRNFSGIRPKLVNKDKGGYGDFVIERPAQIPRTIQLIGIESPGLTSALPIARHVVGLIREQEDLRLKSDFNPCRRGTRTFADQSEAGRQALIAQNPDYGEIICRCESITKAEILAAIRNPLGVETVLGVKIRTRASMGRCQGGYCQTRIVDMLQEEQHKAGDQIQLARRGSTLFTGKVRDL